MHSNWTSNTIKHILDKSRRPVCLHEDAMLFLPSSDMQSLVDGDFIDLKTLSNHWTAGPFARRFGNKSCQVPLLQKWSESANLRPAPDLSPSPVRWRSRRCWLALCLWPQAMMGSDISQSETPETHPDRHEVFEIRDSSSKTSSWSGISIPILGVEHQKLQSPTSSPSSHTYLAAVAWQTWMITE